MRNHVRFPTPLRPGDTIGVTSPSAGVEEALLPRLRRAVTTVEQRGLRVRIGQCLDDAGITSAPVQQRVDEFMDMMLDPTIRAVVPPWGGETAIDMVDQIDYAAISEAEPTWVVGYSDISTLITPLTLKTGVATVHGNNLMDTPYAPANGMVNWLDIVTANHGTDIEQTSRGFFRREGRDDYTAPEEKQATQYTLDAQTPWQALTEPAQKTLAETGHIGFSGRLIGGCIETLTNLAGSDFLDVESWRNKYFPGEPTLVYVEASGDDAGTICRNLHGLRLNGFFDHASGVLIGRTSAPELGEFTQHDAVLDALGGLDLPILADVECGHCVPYMPLLNGAVADVSFDGTTGRILQRLGGRQVP